MKWIHFIVGAHIIIKKTYILTINFYQAQIIPLLYTYILFSLKLF